VRSSTMRSMAFALRLLLMVLCCGSILAFGQITTTSGTVTTSYGYYVWQVDQTNVTTTLFSETGFGTAAPGLVQIPVTIPGPATVHEVHGNIAYSCWQNACSGVPVIAEVRDQNGNVVAAVNVVASVGQSVNMPVSATLSSPISITSLLLQSYTAAAGGVVSWALVMQ